MYLSIDNEKSLSEEQMTAAKGYQTLITCVPVTVTPYAKPGETVTRCCGDPVVVAGETECDGVKNGNCHFTISQTLCIEVPVYFGATATTSEYYVDCVGASEKFCDNCI